MAHTLPGALVAWLTGIGWTDVPLNMLSKWPGHSRIETTAIYANATGAEQYGSAGAFEQKVTVLNFPPVYPPQYRDRAATHPQ
jgi:hypothetical protein